MTDDFSFKPRSSPVVRKRKRSQTVPLIASIVTPAVVMIGFLVYLDRRGFFDPPQAKSQLNPAPSVREEPPLPPVPRKDRPNSNAYRAPRRPVPLIEPPNEPERIAGAPVQLEPEDEAEKSGPEMPSVWEIELPSKEILRSRDLNLTKDQVVHLLRDNPDVWVYVDRGAPEACFPLSTRKARSIGLNEPIFGGIALDAGDPRKPSVAIEFQGHKRTGWFRQFTEYGDTEVLIRFVAGDHRGIACVTEKRRPVYIQDAQDGGKHLAEYFVKVDEKSVDAVPVNRTDAEQAERADNHRRKLLEVIADLDAREKEWRLPFTAWDRRCKQEITAAIRSGGKEAGDKKIEELKAEQKQFRDSLLSGLLHGRK